ncbi:hypothetical protein Tco_0682718 [Tanacetum coccineum]|uniref:Uncharacterized protein n=1 Tax=Tanacetum coccineum TaxID=301880 RepID=A0ABQ4XTC8_9ASTR
MLTLKFAETHNMVAFLEKPAESEGFEQIIDFLNASSIKYDLTINPTIFVLCMLRNLDPKAVKFLMYPRRDTEVSQPSEPDLVADEDVLTERVTKQSNDPLSGEDRLKLKELMILCTNLQTRVLELENTKTSQQIRIGSLERKVKKLEKT